MLGVLSRKIQIRRDHQFVTVTAAFGGLFCTPDRRHHEETEVMIPSLVIFDD
jgi:hypothetical protein